MAPFNDAETLPGKAAAMQPMLRERAREFEEARRLPQDVARALAAIGACRMLVPAEVGGLEVAPRVFSETIEALAIGDASAGWCAMIGATAGMSAAYMPPDAAREIFGDPAIIAGGVFAPMGKARPDGDGFRVSGRWSWGSFSANCDWLSGGCVILEGDGIRRLPSGAPDARMMFFPAQEVELIDTWHVAGLKGTGSGDFAVSEIWVPQERSTSLIADKPTAPGALYAFPSFGLLALGVASVALGNGRAALNAVRELCAVKSLKGSSKLQAERPTVQKEFAETEAAFRAARAYLFDEIDRTWAVATSTGAIPLERRADLRLACAQMTRTAAEATRRAYDIGGGASLFLENDLQRRFRDAHAMTQHISSSPSTFEMLGRVLMGQPTDASII